MLKVEKYFSMICMWNMGVESCMKLSHLNMKCFTFIKIHYVKVRVNRNRLIEHEDFAPFPLISFVHFIIEVSTIGWANNWPIINE